MMVNNGESWFNSWWQMMLKIIIHCLSWSTMVLKNNNQRSRLYQMSRDFFGTPLNQAVPRGAPTLSVSARRLLLTILSPYLETTPSALLLLFLPCHRTLRIDRHYLNKRSLILVKIGCRRQHHIIKLMFKNLCQRLVISWHFTIHLDWNSLGSAVPSTKNGWNHHPLIINCPQLSINLLIIVVSVDIHY